MFFYIFLIVLTYDIAFIASSESDYNDNVLPLVKRKFHRIDNARDIESRLFDTVNRTCVLEVLELTDNDEDYLNSTLKYLNLRNDAINKAFEVCTEERTVVMSEDQLRRNLKNHENANYSQLIDCFKVEYLKYDRNSILLNNSNLIISDENCTEIIDDFDSRLMRGFYDYKARIVRNFNLTICDLKEMMKYGRKIAVRYVLMANGDYPYEVLMSLKNSFSGDARIIVRKIVKCFVMEMQEGNYGVEGRD